MSVAQNEQNKSKYRIRKKETVTEYRDIYRKERQGHIGKEMKRKRI